MHPIQNSQIPTNAPVPVTNASTTEQGLNLRAQNLANDFLKDIRENQLEQRYGPEIGIPFSPHVFKATAAYTFDRLEHLLLDARDTGTPLNDAARQQVKSVLEKGLELYPSSHLGWYLASDFLKDGEQIRVNCEEYSGKRAIRAAKNLATDSTTHTLLSLLEDIEEEVQQPPSPQPRQH